MFEEPKPLVEGSIIDGFTPDPNMSWVAAYAGPCGDPECKEKHTRLYLIPIIGWFQVVSNGFEGVQLRPAIMAANGAVSDYLSIPATFKFIAVLQTSNNVDSVARAVYRERYGDSREIIVGESPSLPN